MKNTTCSTNSNNFNNSLITDIVGLAALLHDMGKATISFQEKIASKKRINSDVMRHERLSAALFYSMYCSMLEVGALKNGDDEEFFSTLAAIDPESLKQIIHMSMDHEFLKNAYSESEHDVIHNLSKDIFLNKNNENVVVFNSVFFLILSHHFLPSHNHNDISEKGYIHQQSSANKITWAAQTPFLNKEYIALFQKKCKSISKHNFSIIYENIEPFSSAILYIARPALIIADQNIAKTRNDKNTELFLKTNTVPFAGSVVINRRILLVQPLLNHLFEVSSEAETLCQFMLKDILKTTLPSLKTPSPELINETPHLKFKWQNSATDITKKLKHSGNLIFVNADTGLGKTQANIKIASALRNNKNLRTTTILQTNALTKQTDVEYTTEMKINHSDCSIITGSTAIHHDTKEDLLTVSYGTPAWSYSENSSFTSESGYNKILKTPIVISTLDHIAECITNGNSLSVRLFQRIQTSDLIIDEISSLHAESLVVIAKLVYLAAMFDRNVVISSSTLRPSEADILIKAFETGISHYNFIFNKATNISGAIISNHDDSRIVVTSEREFLDAVSNQNNAVKTALRCDEIKRKLAFVRASDSKGMLEHIKRLHSAHSVVVDEFVFSVGIIKLNTISGVKSLARELSAINPQDIQIAIISYHSKLPSSIKDAVEKCLNTILKRSDHHYFCDTIREEQELKRTFSEAKTREVKNITLIVVSSSLEENGRDHDFDWCITEPSNHRSLIQIAGLIRRHRECIGLTMPNLLMLSDRPATSLALNPSATTVDSFSETGTDYARVVDARAILTDHKPENEEQLCNINQIEIQDIRNAGASAFEFLTDAHTRISNTHAQAFPLKVPNGDTPCWHDGKNWLIPKYSTKTKRFNKAKTETCYWKSSQNGLQNLLFNSNVSNATFRLSTRELKNINRLYFSSGIGVYLPEDSFFPSQEAPTSRNLGVPV